MTMKRDNSNCSEETLLLYHYGELSGPQRQTLEEHLAACSACRQRLQNLQEDLSCLKQPPLEVSDAQARRLAAAVMAKTRRRPWVYPAWGAALASAALVLTLVMLRPGDLPLNGTSSVVAEMELLENLELLEDLELLQELEELQHLEEIG